MSQDIGKGARRALEPTHKIIGIFDRKQYIEQMTARITERTRLDWHNNKLLVAAKPGDMVDILTRDGYTTPMLVTELQIKVAHNLFSRFGSLDKYIAEEVKWAYRDSGYVDGQQYVLKEVGGERTIASTVAMYQQGGFRDVRAVPIDEAVG